MPSEAEGFKKFFFGENAGVSAYTEIEIKGIEKAKVFLDKIPVIGNQSDVIHKIFFMLNIEKPRFSVKIFAVAVSEEKYFFRRNTAYYCVIGMGTAAMNKFAGYSSKVDAHSVIENDIRTGDEDFAAVGVFAFYHFGAENDILTGFDTLFHGSAVPFPAGNFEELIVGFPSGDFYRFPGA